MKIKATEFKQGKTTLYLGVVRAGDILPSLDYAIWRTDNRDGYQREPTLSRARSFGRYILTGEGISPISVLLNLRKDCDFKYKDGTLSIPDNCKIWVVDGQHRLQGIQEMLNNGNTEVGDFEIPVVITTFPNTYLEAKQFLILNKTQKGVKSDLAERILYRAVVEEGKTDIILKVERRELPSIFKDADWKFTAVEITDALLKRQDTPWYQMIILPNEPRKGKAISQTSFVTSLDPILRDHFFGQKDVETLIKILVNYWNAIRDVWVEPFNDQPEYAIQKLSGVTALHQFLLKIAAYCLDAEGKRIFTREKFKEVLSALPNNGIDDKFWSNDGTAGMVGTSRKGVSIIHGKLLEALSKEKGDSDPDIEL